jgi:hypothetical protein
MCEVDWQALATFVTGILAVAAAIHVGRKQTEILNRQAKIAENQIKIELFGDRVACVKKMHDLYSMWNQDGRLKNEQIREFIDLFYDVELLFPKNIYKEMDEASLYILNIERYHRRASDYTEDRNEAKRKEFLEKAWAEEDKLSPILPQLFQSLKEATRIGLWDPSEIVVKP